MSRPVRHYGKWRIRWRDESNRRKSEVFDTFADAEFALRRHETIAAEIARGLRSPTPRERLFSELCEFYLANFSALKRRQRDDETIVGVHLQPFFGSYLLREVSDHVERYRISRRHLSDKTVHNHLTLLITMLRVAFEKDWITKLPRIRKPRIRLFERDFRYLHTDAEIRRLLGAAREEGELVHALYSTAVFTGMREGELAALKRDDINLTGRLISVQRSYDGPTKNGELRYVPILDALYSTLRNWLLLVPGNLLFPNRAGRMHRDSAYIFQEVFKRVLDRAQFPHVERRGRLRHPYVFHDLRHTFASQWMMKGGDLFRLQKILGHKSVQMTMRYSHLAPHAFAEDHARFGSASDYAGASVFPLAKLS